MAVHYPLHLQERAARIFKQRMAEVDKLRASVAQRLADSIAPPLGLIPVRIGCYPQSQRGVSEFELK
jgi:hypothetical protein